MLAKKFEPTTCVAIIQKVDMTMRKACVVTSMSSRSRVDWPSTNMLVISVGKTSQTTVPRVVAQRAQMRVILNAFQMRSYCLAP